MQNQDLSSSSADIEPLWSLWDFTCGIESVGIDGLCGYSSDNILPTGEGERGEEGKERYHVVQLVSISDPEYFV